MKTQTQTDKATALKLTLDPIPDASGNHVIRLHDGTENGNIEAQPVATCYELAHAALIVRAVNLLPYYEAVAEAAKHFGIAKDSPRAVELHNALAALAAVQGGAK